MSLYQLHKAIYAYLNTPDAERPSLDGEKLRAAFDVTDAEAAAFRAADITALARLGVHPVLLNSYSRARQIPRDAYRAALRAVEGGA
jgi:hypothetical protein